MGDRAYTTLLAWPYPGRDQLSPEVLDELGRHDALPVNDAPIAADYLGHTGAAVLAGDERSGRILAVVDEQASYGTATYAGVIAVLGAAGLHVFAGNDAGGDYGACWEYHLAARQRVPAGAASLRPRRARRVACDLLEAGERTVGEVPDTVLAARTRRLISYPGGIPRAVLAAAY